ncbi:unnamed protein product [Prunus armeniaca]
MPSSLPKGDAIPKGQPPAEAPDCRSSELPNLNTGDTCHPHSNLHKVPHRNFVQTSSFYFPINREQHEIVSVVTKARKNVEKFKVGDCVGVGVIVDSCMKCETCDQDLENYEQYLPITHTITTE